MTPRPRRVGYAVTSLFIDLALLTLTALFAPLHWELPDDRLPVALPLLAFALLGTFLFGGYRVGFPIRRAAASLSGLGLFVGLVLGWLALKLLSQKAGLRDLTPPAVELYALVTLALGLLAFAHRRLHLARLEHIDRQSPIALLTHRADDFIAQLARRGFAGPVTQLPPDGLAAADLDRYRALVIATPLHSLERPDLERIAEARALGLPVFTRASFEEELFRVTPLKTPDDPWLFLDDSLERRSALYLSTKRLIDVLAATLALTVLALPMLLAAVAIKLTSKGPALYRQTRAGLHREPFTLYKLRTMVVDAEADGPRFAAENDTRITPFGRFLRKTRLDETPQFLNILKSEMSLVGPRPERPEFDQRLAPLIPYYALRHLTKPGLTGWAQVRVGYSDSEDTALIKLEHDVYYLKHASTGFDLEILAATIPVILKMRGR